MLGHAIRDNLRRAQQPMAQQFALTHDTPAYNPRYADAFVVFSVTVLSLAIGVWCLLRLGLVLWMGTVAALVVYALLLTVHLAVRRSLVAVDGAAADRASGDLWTQNPYASDESMQQVPEADDADAPRSPGEEIARWTQAARAGELPRARPVDPFDFRPKQEPSLPIGVGLARLADGDRPAADPGQS